MESEYAQTARETWFSRQEQIERALVRGYDPMPIEDVTEQLEEGIAQAWFAENSTVITKVFQRGGETVCEIWLAGGILDEVLELKDKEIEPWAKKLGCTRMLFSGRDGWEKFVPDYKKIAITMIKEL